MLAMCKKCMTVSGALFLLFGVLFLLRDLNIWSFWNIEWWTVGFLLVGLNFLVMVFCPKCLELREKK